MTGLLRDVASMVRWIVFALLMAYLGCFSDPILAYEAVEVTHGGTITGRVVFTGRLPHLPPLVITKDQDVCGTAAAPQALLVSTANQGVKETVVAVEGLTQG